MKISRRRAAGVVLCSAFFVVVLVAWMLGHREPRPPEGGPPTRLPAAHTTVSQVGESTSAVPQDPEASSVSPSFSLRLVDVGTKAAMTAIPVKVARADCDQEPLIVHSDQNGVLVVPSSGPVRLVVLREKLHLVFPNATYQPPDASEPVRSVLLYSTITVRGSIRYEDPSYVSDACATTIVAGPIRRVQGEVDSDEEVVGSPAWIQVNARNLHQMRSSTATNEFVIEVPAIGEVGVCVRAAGHLPELQYVVEPYPIENGEIKLCFDLRLGERLAVRVLNAKEEAVQGASVQLIARRQVPYRDLHYEAEVLVAAATGAGMGITTDRRVTADIKHLACARTDGDGRAQRDQPYRADTLYLVVLARGYKAYIRKLERKGGFDGCTIRLERIDHPQKSYRLRYLGEPVLKGSLVLALRVDGMTPALPTIRARGGRFSAEWIEAGREYVFFLSGASLTRTLNGVIVFGLEEWIEVSEFAED